MMTKPRIELEKPMCDDAAEGAAADHDDVERSTATCGAIERLLERVAHVSPRHIVCESRIFSCEWHGDHVCPGCEVGIDFFLQLNICKL